MVWLLREHGDDHDYEKTLRIDFAKTARVSTFWSGLKTGCDGSQILVGEVRTKGASAR